MTDLITRLEQAEAGSTLLDLEIEQATGEWTNIGGGWQEHNVTGERRVSFKPADPFTTSLDAVTALIGEKLPGWNVTIRIPSDPKHRHVCEIGAPDDPDASITDPWPFRTSAGGSNAPLACAAALLRAIKEGEHG